MKGAVEVVIDAGLGNQLFQYAMGRSLAKRAGRPLVLDISLLLLEPEWGFDLRHFALGDHKVRGWPYLPWNLRHRAVRALAARGVGSMRMVGEPHLQFAPEVLGVRSACIVQGYWQSERYFESIEEQLRKELTFASAQDERNAVCQAQIRAGKSIALHVRRGDYATPEGAAYHGICPKEYYDAALALVVSRIGPGAHLFVFSDSMGWAIENIHYPLPTTYVDWNADRPWEDLRLMSACKGLVMANSTFSWWGGWLIPGKEKVVVAPRKWYVAPGLVSDLPLSRWLMAI